MKSKLLCHVVTLFVTLKGVPGQCWGGGHRAGFKIFKRIFLLVARVFIGFLQMYVELSAALKILENFLLLFTSHLLINYLPLHLKLFTKHSNVSLRAPSMRKGPSKISKGGPVRPHMVISKINSEFVNCNGTDSNLQHCLRFLVC